MSYPRVRVAALAAALLLALTLGLAAAPAGAAVSQQCSTTGTCMNFWNGGFAVRTWQGNAANNHIWIHWLGNGTFELRDGIHGGCVGDLGGAPGNPAMGGGDLCPSGGTADYGTRFQLAASAFCPSGDVVFWSLHWLAYVGVPSGNNHPVSENTTGTCLFPET